jgi:cytohesin
LQRALRQEIQERFQASAAQLEEIKADTEQMQGQWVDVVKILMDHGADLRADLQNNSSLLYMAANLGFLPLVQMLIDSGADMNDLGQAAETPLHGAIAERHRDVAELLVKRGTDLTIKNRSGRTPLHFLAFYMDDQQLAELMIERGAEINAKDKDNDTPLTFAIKAGNKQVAKVLREHGGQ